MSQYQYLRWKGPNSSRDHSTQVSKVIAYGPYEGFLVSASNPGVTRKLDISAGMAFTSEGIKLKEDVGASQVIDVPASSNDFDRIDMVVIKHLYSEVQNPLTHFSYEYIQGVPAANPVPPAYDEATQYPLADVYLEKGSTLISNENIFNRYRTVNTTQLRKELMDTMYYTFGNFRSIGWDVSYNTPSLVYTVSPGQGILGGAPNRTDYPVSRNDLHSRQTLMAASYLDGSGPRYVSDNLDLDKPPDFPTRLRITIAGTHPAGQVRITGTNAAGQVISEDVPFAAGGTMTAVTAQVFRTVAQDGVDAGSLTSGTPATIEIKDKPQNRIIVVGSEAGRARFKANPDPSYVLQRNELCLGILETDETSIVAWTAFNTHPWEEIREDLQCNGSAKQWSLMYPPLMGTLEVILDGLWLKPGSPKGFSVSGQTLSLGVDIDPPDQDTDLWVNYKPALQ